MLRIDENDYYIVWLTFVRYAALRLYSLNVWQTAVSSAVWSQIVRANRNFV